MTHTKNKHDNDAILYQLYQITVELITLYHYKSDIKYTSTVDFMKELTIQYKLWNKLKLK